MTQEEVLVYNRRCAEFLKAESIFINEFELYGIVSCIDDGEYEQHFFEPKDMKFHSDWNWIMEMVEAIENKSKYIILGKDLYSSFDIGKNHIKFYFNPNNKYLLQLELQQFLPDEPWVHPMYPHRIIKQFDFKKHGRKKAVVQAINQFLTWYEIQTSRT